MPKLSIFPGFIFFLHRAHHNKATHNFLYFYHTPIFSYEITNISIFLEINKTLKIEKKRKRASSLNWPISARSSEEASPCARQAGPHGVAQAERALLRKSPSTFLKLTQTPNTVWNYSLESWIS
jgi:hypothetical protein